MFVGSIVTVSYNSVEELEDTNLGCEGTLYRTEHRVRFAHKIANIQVND
jgi:hypothetical protein